MKIVILLRIKSESAEAAQLDIPIQERTKKVRNNEIES